MLINSLVLYNVGIFQGAHTLELTCRDGKNIILIGGLNGRGKTTILEAVLFALYGKRICSLTDGNWNFEQYLDKLGNCYAEDGVSYVELLFQVDEEEREQSYKIRREWNRGDTKVRNKVWKDEAEDAMLATNWDMFIEDILPIAVAPFFFFDGEKISELATSGNDRNLMESVKNLLGLNILEQAMRDLKVVLKNNQNNIKIADYKNELSGLQAQLADIRQETGQLESEKSDCEEMITRKSNNLNSLDAEFSAAGGNLFEQRTELKNRKQQLDMELQVQYEKLLGMASGDMPLYLVKDLLRQIEKKAELEKKENDEEVVLRRLPLMFDNYRKVEKNIDFDMDKFLKFIERERQYVECNYKLTDESYIRLKTIEAKEMDKRQELKSAMDHIRRCRRELEEINNQLEIDLNDSAIQKNYRKVKELTAELAVLQERLSKINLNLDEKQSQLERLENEEHKLLDKAASELDEMDDTRRIIEYAEKELRVLQIYKARLQEQKAKRLSETITDCFKVIISKRDLMNRIELDSQMTTFAYYDAQMNQIRKETLSAGEQQLLVIAILWGLGICSDKKLPVVIDTPLGRLDSYHREMLIKNYFPKASKQMIILSTDREITSEDYEILKESICKEYTLVYDEKTKGSRIVEKYFGDVR